MVNVTTSMVFQRLEPIPRGAPVISGTVKEGETLTITAGFWRRSRHTETYVARVYDELNQLHATLPFSGATVTYVPVAANVGYGLYVEVEATNAFGSAVSRSKLTGDVVEADPVLPVNTALPAIVGTPQVGSLIVYTVGEWENLPAQNYIADIQVDGVSQGASYVPVAADVGDTVTVTIIAFNSDGQSLPATSAASAPIAAAPVLGATYDFGAGARAGLGGIPIPAGSTAFSGTAGGLEISNGYVVPTGNGSVTAGTVIFNNGGPTINILASADTVACRIDDAGAAEFLAVMAWLDTFDAGGYTVLLRDGTYVAPVYFTGSYTSAGAPIYNDTPISLRDIGNLWSDFVTIKSSTTTSPIVMRGGVPAAWIQKISFRDCNKLFFTDVKLGRPKGQVNTSGFSGGTNEGVYMLGCDGMKFIECLIESDPTSADNCNTGITFGYSHNITIQRCKISGTFNAMGAGNTGFEQQNITIEHNWFHKWSSNNIQLYGSYRYVKFNFNKHGEIYKPVTSGTTHVDCNQQGTQNNNSDTYKDFEMIGNCVDIRTGTGDAQFIFHREMPNIPTSLWQFGSDAPAEGHLERWWIMGNHGYHGQSASITMGWGDRIIIANNGAVAPPGFSGSTTPGISLTARKARQYRDAEGVMRTYEGNPYPVTNALVIGNVSNRFSYDPTDVSYRELRNFTLTAGNLAQLQALFTDPEQAVILDAVESLAGGPLTTVASNSRAYKAGPDCPYITHAVWDADGLVSEGSHDFPVMEEGYPSPDLAALTEQALNTTVNSGYNTVSGTSATGVFIGVFTAGFSIRLVDAADSLIVAGVDHVVANNGEKWRIEMTTPAFGGDTYVCDYIVGAANAKQWSVGVAAGGAYAQNFVRNDGNDYFTRLISSVVADGPRGMFAATIKFNAGSNGTLSSLFSIGGKFSFQKNSQNKLYLGLRGSGSLICGSWTSGTTYTNSATPVHVAASWDFSDTNNLRLQVFVNGVDVSNEAGAVRNINSGGGLVKYSNGATSAILANSGAGAYPMYADVSDLYINMTESIDLTTNIGLFYSGGAPVDLGPVGEYPTGNQPAIFAGRTMDAAGWNSGSWLGTINGWTAAGSVTDV